MTISTRLRRPGFALLFCAMIATAATAQNFGTDVLTAASSPTRITGQVVWNFAGYPGAAEPEAALISDPQGNVYGNQIYGTTLGGSIGYGEVFEITE